MPVAVLTDPVECTVCARARPGWWAPGQNYVTHLHDICELPPTPAPSSPAHRRHEHRCRCGVPLGHES